MKAFAVFFEDGVKPLGSDTVFILDARNKITTQILDAKAQLERLKQVKPYLNGYAIYSGNIKHNRVMFTRNVTKEQAENW